MLLLSARDQRRHMGVECRIEVIAPNAPLLLDRCYDVIAELERLWSRFLPDSDITRLNHAHGQTTRVDPRTVALLAAMKAAFAATSGSFNPTRLPEQVASGDAQSLVSRNVTHLPDDARVWESLDDLVVSADNTVTMPDTMTLDAGGIAKGFAADLIAEFAVANGALAACVNLGGDIRVINSESHRHDFAIDVVSPIDSSQTLSTVSLRNGAIATSAVNARQRVTRGVAHHIQGAHTDLVAASVIASTATWAEVWTKHAIVCIHGLDDINSMGLAALSVDCNATTTTTPTWKDFTKC